MQRNVQDAVTKEMKEWLFKYVIIHNNLLLTHTNKMLIKKNNLYLYKGFAKYPEKLAKLQWNK